MFRNNINGYDGIFCLRDEVTEIVHEKAAMKIVTYVLNSGKSWRPYGSEHVDHEVNHFLGH